MKIDKEDIREAFEILEGEMQRDVDSWLIDYAPEYKGTKKTDKPKRYIKIEKDGRALIVDTYLKTAIEAEYADVWLNCENKSRMEAEDTAKELRRELAKLRGASFKTTRTIVDLRQRRRRATACT